MGNEAEKQMVTVKTCRVCGGGSLRAVRSLAFYLADETLTYELMECRNCQFNFTYGPYTKEILSKIYEARFHASSQQAGPLISDEITQAHLRYPVVGNARSRASKLEQLGLRGSLLDVGSGKGYFVKAALPHFKASGIELSQDAVDFAKQMHLDVRCDDFITYDSHSEKWDVVTMWDVLSGFDHPDEIVQKVRQLLNPKGYFVFTIPDAHSMAARLLGSYWPLMIPPINVSYFTKKSIQLLLKKNGFKILNIYHDTKYVSFDFLVQKLKKTVLKSVVINKKVTFAPRVKIPVNMLDILTVVARVDE